MRYTDEREALWEKANSDAYAGKGQKEAARYNLTVMICANIAVSASSPEVAKRAVEKTLEDAVSMEIGIAEFVIEHGEITGIYDTEWHAIEEEVEHEPGT